MQHTDYLIKMKQHNAIILADLYAEFILTNLLIQHVSVTSAGKCQWSGEYSIPSVHINSYSASHGN